MKKISSTILVFLLATTFIGHAQLYLNQEINTKEFKENPSDNLRGSDNSGGIFKTDAPNLDDRPTNGEGIGQEMPLKDGLVVLVVCSGLYGIVKTIQRGRGKFR